MKERELPIQIQEIIVNPSQSEEEGLSLIQDTDLCVFCPGISTNGIAEIRLAHDNPNRIIVATTIDEKGYSQTKDTITNLGYDNQVIAKFEDLTKEFPYENDTFDFIYARLVLHYLSYQELDHTLNNFYHSLKQNGRIYVVVRSVKNIEGKNLPYDPHTRLTQEPYGVRYYHTPESISNHLTKAGFRIGGIKEMQEQLYKDYQRTVPSPILDHIIQVIATKE